MLSMCSCHAAQIILTLYCCIDAHPGSWQDYDKRLASYCKMFVEELGEDFRISAISLKTAPAANCCFSQQAYLM